MRALGIIVLCAGMLAPAGEALPPTPTGGGGSCPPAPTTVAAAAVVREQGTAATGRTVTLDASASELVIVRNCTESTRPLPSVSWTLVSRPGGSAAALALEKLRASLPLDRVGSYRVRFTACPGGCQLSLGGVVHHVPAKVVERIITVIPTNRPMRASSSPFPLASTFRGRTGT